MLIICMKGAGTRLERIGEYKDNGKRLVNSKRAFIVLIYDK